MDTHNTIDVLNQARRPLDSLSNVKIIDDWNYDTELNVWFLHICISIEYDSFDIPHNSNWYVVVDSEYPKGKIKVYPDVNNSLKDTLYHQGNNSYVEKNGLWKKGALCLDVNTLKCYQREPHTIDERLFYHVKRSINWIELAAQGKLVEDDEPFELPEFSMKHIRKMRFAFSEDIISYMQWESTTCRYGIAELDSYKSSPSILYVKTFKSIDGKVIHSTHWGQYLSKYKSSPLLLSPWILLKEVPTINKWQAPETFGDLIEICEKQNIDIINILKQLFSRIRDRKRHLLLVGFPIPKLFGGENEIVFWMALYLPILSYGKKTANGFRNNQLGWWMRDMLEVCTKKAKLEWITSENWNQNEITQRGKMDKELLRKRILLIGAGCMGASISELLVRSGVYSLTILDYDTFEIGNMTRHTLDLDCIGDVKATSLCNHLNLINPHANVKFINDKLICDSKCLANIDMSNYEIIIDCTGENDVLNIFSNIKYDKSHVFVSASVGLGAKRMYITLKKGNEYNFSSFAELISPYLCEDKELFDDFKLPRNGIGCWHPTFPGRSDDIYLAAATAVKMIEKFVINTSLKDISLVYEQEESDMLFEGYQVVDKCEK